MSARTHYLNARQTLRRLLDLGVVPVINENDTTTTDEISFGDNDFLAAQVAVLIGADRLVLLTDTDGLYTGDPRIDPTAALVERGVGLRHAGHDADRSRHVPPGIGRDALEGRRRRDGHGRRDRDRHRQRAAAGGARPRAGRRAGGHGASRHAGAGYSSFKLWLRYAKSPHGTVRVDAGAARALREGGTSLLPVGIVGVEGRFDVGDAIEVAHDGHVIGKGISNYTADELRQVKGMKSAEVRDLLPRATEEAVHRDYFVLAVNSPHGTRPADRRATSASRRATPRASSPGSTRGRATRRCSRSPTRSSPARERSWRPTRRTSSPAASRG